MRSCVFHFRQCLLALCICWFLPRFPLWCTTVCPEVDFLEFESPQFCKYILLGLQPFCRYILYSNILFRLSFQLNHSTLNTQSLNHHTYDRFVSFVFTTSMIKLVHSNCGLCSVYWTYNSLLYIMLLFPH